MKTLLTISLAALFGLSLSAKAYDEEGKARFESSGFLQSLDALILEQAKQAEDKPTSALDALAELKLSNRPSKKEGSSPFKLSDSRLKSPASTASSSDLPDFSSLLAPSGSLRGSALNDMLSARSSVHMGFGKKDDKSGAKPFELVLESTYRLSADGLPGTSQYINSDLANRDMGVGLSARYAGFGLDASIFHQTGFYVNDLTSIDVGLSYKANRWAARLSLSDYTEGTDLYGIENEARNFISVELGASVRLTDTIGFSGGVRYYDYGDRWMLNPDAGENSQMLFLGGRLKF